MLKEAERSLSIPFRDRLSSELHMVFKPGDTRWLYYLFIPICEIPALLTHSRIEFDSEEARETFPKEGPAMIISNHADWKDPIAIQWAVIAASRRLVHNVIKRTLLDPDAKETEAAEKKRTQKDVIGAKPSGLISKFFRHRIVSPFMRATHGIPVDIGGSLRQLSDFSDAIAREVGDGQLFGIFPQAHRKPPLDLLDFYEGAAIIARRHPHLPVVPAGISGSDRGFIGISKVRIRIGETLHYADFEAEGRKRPTIRGFTDLIADRVGELIDDPYLKPAWELNRKFGYSREVLLQIIENGNDLAEIAATCRQYRAVASLELRNSS